MSIFSVKISLVTTNQQLINISMESDKTIKDLRKAYFEKIRRPDLINHSIFFLYGGENIALNENELLGKIFKKARRNYTVLVVDNN